MARALQLARRGLYTTHPNPRVGSIVCRNGVIIGEGWHQRTGEAHAEIHALQMAGENATGACLYVTLEPCAHQGRTPPCADAIIAAGIRRVIIAMIDPNPLVAGRSVEKLRAAGVEVGCGLLETQARELNPGFISRMQRSRPWIRLKLAASLDGRTAMANGESQWITGPAARADVQHWRACSDAIITGIGTVLGDDPQLNVRPQSLAAHRHYPPGPVRQPLRVILDTQARTPLTARILDPADETVLISAKSADRLSTAQQQVQVDQNSDQSGLDLHQVVNYLHTQHQINEAWIESGPHLAGAFLQADLVDEIIVYQAPLFLGHDARPLVYLPGMEHLGDGLEFEFKDVSTIGTDLRLRLGCKHQ